MVPIDSDQFDNAVPIKHLVNSNQDLNGKQSQRMMMGNPSLSLAKQGQFKPHIMSSSRAANLRRLRLNSPETNHGSNAVMRNNSVPRPHFIRN